MPEKSLIERPFAAGPDAVENGYLWEKKSLRDWLRSSSTLSCKSLKTLKAPSRLLFLISAYNARWRRPRIAALPSKTYAGMTCERRDKSSSPMRGDRPISS